MPNDVEKLYDICDEVYDNYRKLFIEITEKIGQNLRKRLEEKDIPIRIYENEEKTISTDSKQLLMSCDRIMSLLSTDLNFHILFP